MRYNILGITLLFMVHSCMVDVAHAAAIETDIVCPAEQKDDSFVVQYASKVSCNIFYKCNRGVAIKVECSDGLHYNERIQACDYPSRANCQLNTRSDEPGAESITEVQELPTEVLQEARSAIGPRVEETLLSEESKLMIAENQDKKLTAHKPKLPELDSTKKELILESNEEISKINEKETLQALPQPNNISKESVISEHPKLPSNDDLKVPQKADNLKSSKESEEPKKKETLIMPVADSKDDNKKLSKQLRVTSKQPLKKPNREPTPALEEESKSAEKSPSDQNEEPDKKDGDSQKMAIGKEKKTEKNESTNEAKSASLESDESPETVQEAISILDDYQPKPIRRTSSQDSEQNSRELSSNDVFKGKPIVTIPIETKKGSKKPIEINNDSKKPIELKNKTTKESNEEET